MNRDKSHECSTGSIRETIPPWCWPTSSGGKPRLSKRLAILSVGAILGVFATGLLPAFDTAHRPPAGLRSLDRLASLKVAHLRDEGSTDPDRRAQLNEAQQLDLTAEREIAAGAYDRAEDSLKKADAILIRLGM